jgi:hypothetical protein
VRQSGDGTERLGGELGGGGERSGWGRKTGRKGERGRRWLLWRPGGAGGEEKGAGGPGFGVTWMGKWGRERGPRRGGGQLEQPTIAPGRWARVAPLPHDRGGGRTRATRARETGRRDQVTSGPSGQRLGVGGSERERGNGGSGR